MRFEYCVGQRVKVEGNLPSGDWKGCDVNCDGTIVEIRKTGLFICLDEVDHDTGVHAIIPKKMIRPTLKTLLDDAKQWEHKDDFVAILENYLAEMKAEVALME